MVSVRNAVMADAERILEIYDYYVKNTAITFEYDTPSMEEFKARMARIMNRYPYLVIEEDKVLQGYAYADVFVGRAAYGWSCELTVYLDHKTRKNGMGRTIYEALERELQQMGMLNLYACIGYPEANDEYLITDSADFHAHMGFAKIGEFHKCRHKFDRWYNMIWMEKIIGEHRDKQPPIICYPELEKP